MADVIVGTGEDGADVLPGDPVARFMLKLRARQEAVWAVLVKGRVVIELDRDNTPDSIEIYVPNKYQTWWEQNSEACNSSIRGAIEGSWEVSWEWLQSRLRIGWLLDVPPDLRNFVAENTGRPMPRRYNTTAVQLFDRDGVAWLTAPEVKLYDALKQTPWLFTPQPPFLAGEEFDRRVDFLIYWNNRADRPVIVEVESEAFHQHWQRPHDEARRREFESRGFTFLSFTVKEINASPTDVLKNIATFCKTRFGG